MNRREFLVALAATAFVGGAATSTRPVRRRGFNLLELFDPAHPRPFAEGDFAMMAEWGFDFIRLPMSYWCWSSANDPTTVREDRLKLVDHAVELGRQHGIHVNLNLHRIPGYCVNPPKEPTVLWTDPKALDAAAFQWGMLAKRYKGISGAAVSFDLINEPADLPVAQYGAVVRRLVEAIRAEDADRPIVADGLKWGTTPVAELASLGISQSTRGYTPMRVSHHRASWIHGSETWPEPTWPLTIKPGDVWDKDRLQREQIAPWQRLAAMGVGVHVGEWGSYNRTPYDVTLRWMRDQLELWQAAGWGWSLWNLHGSFGILDSKRPGATYEAFRGFQLDRGMLELLQEH